MGRGGVAVARGGGGLVKPTSVMFNLAAVCLSDICLFE